MSWEAGSILVKSYGRKCPYCGEPMIGGLSRPTKDHRLPRSRGGKLLNGNRVICCAKCNGDKASQTLEEFLGWLECRRDPRAEHVRAYLAYPIVDWNPP